MAKIERFNEYIAEGSGDQVVFYESIKPIGELDKLKIIVDYELGGYNYFSSQISERGVYVYVTPVGGGKYGEQSVLFGKREQSGFKVCVKKLNRKSQKEIERIGRLVAPLTKEIAEMYDQRRFREICEMLLKLA